MTELSIAIVCMDAVSSTDGAPEHFSQDSSYTAALCSALSCQFAGFSDITLYHNVANVTARSAQSVTLSPNASRVLRTLGALELLEPWAFEPQFIHQRSHRTGFQLSTLALGAMAQGRYNAPYLNVQEDHLWRELVTLAEARAIRLKPTDEITAIGQTAAGVTLADQEGAKIQHDVLIVAGDASQRLRELAGAEILQRSATGFTHWYGSLDAQDLPSGAFGPVVTQWLGPDHHLSYHFGANAERLHLSAITADSTTDSLGLQSARQDRNLAAKFEGWHPSLTALLASTDNMDATPVATTTTPERLAHGRVVFLGSSCHAIVPHLPQQTALGIEDAWVSARMLEQWEEEPASGWVEYEKYRLPRAGRVQSKALQQAQDLCTAAPMAIWRRNLALTFGSRFLPELAMQKNDWLFGYDAVNGFE